jgi:hypothetical protein
MALLCRPTNEAIRSSASGNFAASITLNYILTESTGRNEIFMAELDLMPLIFM